MSENLNFKDLNYDNAVALLTDPKFAVPGKDKYGYLRASSDLVPVVGEFHWFDSIDEMKDHLLNAWLPAGREERDEDYYKDIDTFKNKMDRYHPSSLLGVSDLIGFSEEHDIGWHGHITTLLEDCPDIKEWFSEYLKDKKDSTLALIDSSPLPEEALERLCDFLVGMNIGDYGGFSIPD